MEEKGDENEAIKENDAKTICHFLERFGVDTQPENITRLGKPNTNKKRTLKVEMNSKQDKEIAMGNLNRLTVRKIMVKLG